MTARYERERFRADLAKVRAEHPHLDIGDPPRELVTLKERRLAIMRRGISQEGHIMANETNLAALAEGMWQAECRRLCNRDRLIPWQVEDEETRAIWLGRAADAARLLAR